ncbi:MAG TPA: nitrate ABC transporter substrate-binding protein, partial [Microcoleaceae bacterium UBA10368]|nr:nitrate ABC transporter substrate-binding protein [Microcoleaceae cyanobacterium UBA10368]
MKSKQLTFLTLIFLPFLMAIFIKGCSFGTGALKPFKVGLNTWPGYQVALYAQATGLFRKHGLEVEFVRFTNQQDNIR